MRLILSLWMILLAVPSLAGVEITAFSSRVADQPEIDVLVSKDAVTGDYKATVNVTKMEHYGGQNACTQHEQCTPPPSHFGPPWVAPPCCLIISPIHEIPVGEEHYEFGVKIERVLPNANDPQGPSMVVFSDIQTGSNFRAAVPLTANPHPDIPNCEISLAMGHASGNFRWYCYVQAQ